MTDLVTARHGTADDVSLTAELAEAERGTLRDERGGRWHIEHDTVADDAAHVRHTAALDDTNSVLVVGCVDDVVVGFGLAALSTTRDGVLCMIDELIVHPEARAIGVGSAVLAAIEQWAREHRAQAIESHVLPGNRSAKNFFERVGMKTRKMRVSADL